MLNQQYTQYLDTTYCRLAIGAQSRFCEVHDKFRCIVVVDSEQAYTKLDAPLLNRFEKQVLSRRELLKPETKELERVILKWCLEFVSEAASGLTRVGSSNTPQGRAALMSQISAAFIGFNDETIPSLLRSLELLGSCKCGSEGYLEAAKDRLLWLCTPEALLRTQLSSLQAELPKNRKKYFEEQEHSSLPDLLKFGFSENSGWDSMSAGMDIFCVTFSPLAVYGGGGSISTQLRVKKANGSYTKPTVISLSDFISVRQLDEVISTFSEGDSDLLVIQEDCKTAAAVQRLSHAKTLTSGARSTDELKGKTVVLVAHMQKEDSSCGVTQPLSLQFSAFPNWRYVTLDTLLIDPDMPPMSKIIDMSVEDILHSTQGMVNLKALLASNMRRCIAFLGYPRAVRPEPVELYESLLGLLQIPAFESILRLRIAEMISTESLQTGWQSRMSTRSIAAAGTFALALNRELSSLVVSAFCQWMGVSDVNSNIKLLTTLDLADNRRRVWLDIAQDASQTLAQFPVVTKAMERAPVSITDSSFEPIHCEFPFSNIVYKKVLSVLTQTRSMSTAEIVSAIDATAIGKVLGTLNESDCDHYMTDAVRFARLTSRPVKDYVLIANACVKAYACDQGWSLNHVAQVHMALEGAEANIRSLLELQGMMEAKFGDFSIASGIKSSLLSVNQGLSLVSYVEAYCRGAVNYIINRLKDDGRDEDVRLDDFVSAVNACNSKLVSIFSWGSTAHPDFLELHNVSVTWVHCRLTKDFIKMVLLRLDMDTELETAMELLESLRENAADGFTMDSFYLILEHLFMFSSSHPDTRASLWAFLEHYINKYTFEPVMVGSKPDEETLAVLAFLAGLQGDLNSFTAPEPFNARIQKELCGRLEKLSGSSAVELSTQCRVNIVGSILNCGYRNFLDPQDEIGNLLEAFLKEARDHHAKKTPEASLDNLFSVLLVQGMEDSLISEFETICSGKPNSDLDVKQRQVMGRERLVKWADDATQVIFRPTVPLRPRRLVPWLFGLAQFRVVLMHAAIDLGTCGMIEHRGLREAAERLVTLVVNRGASEESLRSEELFFMKHLSKKMGMQQAILTLLGQDFKGSALACSRLGLGNIINPEISGHIPSVDPFYHLHATSAYDEIRLKVRVSLCNGKVGVNDLEVTRFGSNVDFLGEMIPALAMATHYEAVLGRRSLEDRPGAGIISGDTIAVNSDPLMTWLEDNVSKANPLLNKTPLLSLFSRMLGSTGASLLPPPFSLHPKSNLEESFLLPNPNPNLNLNPNPNWRNPSFCSRLFILQPRHLPLAVQMDPG